MNALDVNNYLQDGFVKVCDVATYDNDLCWYYTNVNKDVMFADHRSWVYFICVDEEIVKVGESGNPLGIPFKTTHTIHFYDDNPRPGTDSRLGRYRRGCLSDEDVRNTLLEEAKQGKVSFYAKKCDLIPKEIVIGGTESTTYLTYHKDLEYRYLDYIMKNTGSYPRCNKARK